MNLSIALGDTIRSERQARGWNLRTLSAHSHISLGYLSEIERGSKEMSSAVLECVAKGLSIPAYKIVADASEKMKVSEEFANITNGVAFQNSVNMEKVLTF
jgi:transcriptional regulator with XRE-family HTH domain